MPGLLKGNPLDGPDRRTRGTRRHPRPDRHAETIGLVENNKNDVGIVLENRVVNRMSVPMKSRAGDSLPPILNAHQK